MVISEEAAKLFQQYKEKCEVLEKRLNDSQNHAERKLHLEKFSKNNLLLPKYWIRRLHNEESHNYDTIKKIMFQALFDFYSEEVFNSLDTPFRTMFESEEKPFNRLMKYRNIQNLRNECMKLLGTPELLRMLQEELSYPHSELIHVYAFYNQFSSFPVPHQLEFVFMGMQRIYYEIKAVENDSVKWFEALVDTNDERFIVQNVEHKLSTEYLEMAAYEVYYRYRRILIKDTSMDGDFEKFNAAGIVPQSQYLLRMKFQRPIFKVSRYLSSILKSRLSFKPIQQQFPFHATILSYIIDTGSPEVVQKLFECGKYFYFKFQKPICHALFVGDRFEKTKYFKVSLTFNVKEKNWNGPKNFWLSNSLVVESLNQNANLLKSILPKFNACTIRYLILTNQNITISQYNFLTESGNIENLSLYNGSIKDEDNNPILFESLLKRLPNLYHIEIFVEVGITAESGKKCNNLKFNEKIKFFKIRFISAFIDPYEFAVFLHNNMSYDYGKRRISCSVVIRNGWQEFMENYRKHANKLAREKGVNFFFTVGETSSFYW